MALIEREAELARIEAAFEAVAGQGSTLLIEGEPGIGKTALLHAAVDLAVERGFQVLAARAADLEGEVGFGVVRQLFEPPVREIGDAGRAELLRGAAQLAAGPLGLTDPFAASGAPPAPGAALHGLYWLCASLADRGPVLIAIDDLHWADEPSLQFVAFLARRVGEHSLLICAASRPVRPGSRGSAPLAALGAGAYGVLRPEPLSPAGVERVVRESLSADAEPGFCRACARASGGNPFLLTEAIAALRADGIAPVDNQAKRVEGLRPETVSRTLLVRLARLEPAAAAVADALAVLGSGTPLRRVAQLADLDLETAAAAADGLRKEGIVEADDALAFTHPMIASAIEGDMSRPARALTHLRAARLLAEEGEESGWIASHLLVAEPSGDPWVVDVLRKAAGEALAAGAPEPAGALLARALQEPPRPPDRAPLLAQLGGARTLAGRPDEGAESLAKALELTEEPVARAKVALDLGGALFIGRQEPAALQVFERARDDLDESDPELLLQLETEIAFMKHATLEAAPASLGTLEARVERSVGDSPARRTAQALLAYMAASTGSRDAAEVARMARSASRTSPSPEEGFLLLPFASAALDLAGYPLEAIELLDRGIEAAVKSADEPRYSFLLSFRSRALVDAGRVRDAEGDALAAVEAHAPGPASISHMVGILLLAFVERSRLDEAQAVLDEHAAAIEVERGLFPYTVLLWPRGRLRIAQRRYRDALEDLTRCGEMVNRVGFTVPTNQRWRSDAALAHVALGEHEPACRLATEELEHARAFGAPMPIGVALRTLGLVEGGDEGNELLQESVSVLEASEAELERARSLVELGAALRRAGHRGDARESLRQGLDLASRCGAPPVVERARAELVAAGGRPRRAAVSGPDSLTPSELRVARLAAEGRTNREIAQALFVTRRTVEVHLTSAYRKLQIDSREALNTALQDETPG